MKVVNTYVIENSMGRKLLLIKTETGLYFTQAGDCLAECHKDCAEKAIKESEPPKLLYAKGALISINGGRIVCTCDVYCNDITFAGVVIEGFIGGKRGDYRTDWPVSNTIKGGKITSKAHCGNVVSDSYKDLPDDEKD